MGTSERKALLETAVVRMAQPLLTKQNTLTIPTASRPTRLYPTNENSCPHRYLQQIFMVSLLRTAKNWKQLGSLFRRIDKQTVAHTDNGILSSNTKK